ncbi:MAG: sodium:solute symporter family protein [Candidatus Glassbacteria bacterium]
MKTSRKIELRAGLLCAAAMFPGAGNALAAGGNSAEGISLHAVDLAAILVFIALLFWAGLKFYRWVGEAEDFTVAGRNLPPFILAATMAASNFNLFGLVSQTGTIWRHGISIIWQGWTGCMALALAGLFILPVLRRLKVATLPEFLERRFDSRVRALAGFFAVIRLAFWLGVVLNTAVRASEMISGPSITAGLNSLGDHFGLAASAAVNGSYIFWVALYSVLVILYTFTGGMYSVAILDSVCFVVIVAGSLVVLPLSMKAVGGFFGMVEQLSATSPGHLDLMPAEGLYSWSFVLAMFFLGIQWASTDPGLVQKSFSSRDSRALATGLVLAGLVTVPYVLLIFLPPLAAKILYPALAHQDYAYPALIVNLVPTGLLGLVCVGLLASQFSTTDANLTSAATIFTNDIYRNVFRREAGQRELLVVARAVILVIGVLMILFSFLVPLFENAVEAYVTVAGFMDMPLFVIAVAAGLLWKRASPAGAIAGYLGGIAVGAAVLFPFKYAAYFGLDPASWAARNHLLAGTIASAAGALALCVAVSLLSARPDEGKVAAVWSMRAGSEEERSAGGGYNIWPESASGKFWIAVLLAGTAVFLVGVLCGATGRAIAGWLAIGGMVIFFIGALARLRCD